MWKVQSAWLKLPAAVAEHTVRKSAAAARPQGARIVFMPNNEGGLPAEDKLEGYRAIQVSRATENMVYGVMCNAPQVSHAWACGAIFPADPCSTG